MYVTDAIYSKASPGSVQNKHRQYMFTYFWDVIEIKYSLWRYSLNISLWLSLVNTVHVQIPIMR